MPGSHWDHNGGSQKIWDLKFPVYHSFRMSMETLMFWVKLRIVLSWTVEGRISYELLIASWIRWTRRFQRRMILILSPIWTGSGHNTKWTYEWISPPISHWLCFLRLLGVNGTISHVGWIQRYCSTVSRDLIIHIRKWIRILIHFTDCTIIGILMTLHLLPQHSGLRLPETTPL